MGTLAAHFLETMGAIIAVIAVVALWLFVLVAIFDIVIPNFRGQRKD